MTSLDNGMLVQHASLGLGKVIAVERSAVHVVFAAQGDHVATKLRLPLAFAFLSPAAPATVWPHPITAFALDEDARRYRSSPGAEAKRPRSTARARRTAAATEEIEEQGSET
jgi:hypothetical protein